MTTNVVIIPGFGPYYTVNGSHATTYEYNVALALDKLRYEYIFQYSILGGRRTRGGQVIDFLVYTAPLATPVFVNGDYWHKDSKQELLEITAVIQALRGQVNEPVILWGKDSATPEAALSSVRRYL